MTEWVTIREAAVRLGRSEDTIRRWVRDGSLRSRQDPFRQGAYRWLIGIEQPDGNSLPIDSTDQVENLKDRALVSDLTPMIPASEVIAFLREYCARLWDELEARRTEISELHALLREERARASHTHKDRQSQATPITPNGKNSDR
jgi:hypothetical protein